MAGHGAAKRKKKYADCDRRLRTLLHSFEARPPLEFLRGIAHNLTFNVVEWLAGIETFSLLVYCSSLICSPLYTNGDHLDRLNGLWGILEIIINIIQNSKFSPSFFIFSSFGEMSVRRIGRSVNCHSVSCAFGEMGILWTGYSVSCRSVSCQSVNCRSVNCRSVICRDTSEPRNQNIRWASLSLLTILGPVSFVFGQVWAFRFMLLFVPCD